HYPEPSRELQKAAFRAQVLLANRLKLPIEVHDRDAHGDVFAIISELRPHGCLHRYSGSPEQAHEYAKLGMHLGIGGALTYHNSKKEIATVEQLPLESLLLETDCPYLAPAQRRGTTSTSEMISIVAERISEIKGNVTPQQIIDITTANAKALFRIK
ncbi:MAG: TatD family hydrolase, partial [Oscillospiraceae bacterium]